MNPIEQLRRILTPAQRPEPVPIAVPPELTMYGEDWCGDCRRAKRHLDEAGIAYRWVDLGVDRAAKAMLRAAGLRAIPVIATTDGRVLVEPTNAQLRDLVGSLA